MTQNTNVIQTIFGRVVGQTTTAKISIFVVDIANQEDGDGFVYNGRLPTTLLKDYSWLAKIPAATPRMAGVNPKFLAGIGEWTPVNYSSVPDDTILTIQVSVTRVGAAYADGVLFCKARASGPLNVVRATLFDAERMGHQSTLDIGNFVDNEGRYSVSAISGRFDFLTLQDIKDMYKDIVFPNGFTRRYFDAEELQELFSVKEIAPSLIEVATNKVVTATGRTVVMKSVVQKRKIILPNKRG